MHVCFEVLVCCARVVTHPQQPQSRQACVGEGGGELSEGWMFWRLGGRSLVDRGGGGCWKRQVES